MVISVAPLGLIGIVAAMLPTRTPMGFVAILGVISLVGMIIRNGVILMIDRKTVMRGKDTAKLTGSDASRRYLDPYRNPCR